MVLNGLDFSFKDELSKNTKHAVTDFILVPLPFLMRTISKSTVKHFFTQCITIYCQFDPNV